MRLEKLDVLKRIDGEVLDLLDEDSLGEEIELSDGFIEDIYATLVKLKPVALRSFITCRTMV